MNGLRLLALASSVTAAAAGAALAVRPPRRLASRVRPYLASARAGLGHRPDPLGPAHPGPGFGPGVIRRLLAPMAAGAARWLGRLIPSGAEAQLELRLRRSGLFPETAEGSRVQAYRIQTLYRSAGLAAGLGLFALFAGGSGTRVLGYAGCGAALGVFLARSRVREAVRRRRELIRSELYTINQLTAMRSRVGGGAAEAVRYAAERAAGEAAGEMADALALHRRGWSFGEAFERAARMTPEPEAARTYRVIAACHQRGADLSGALLDLAKELRAARRYALRSSAARRRLLMVFPIVVVLAPVTLLFLAAPIPTLIFGG